MTLAMMVMMICSTIISQTSNSSSSGSRWARTKTKTLLESNGQNLFRTVEKSWKIKLFGHSRASKKNKKNTFCLTISPVLGNLTHMRQVIFYISSKKCALLSFTNSYGLPFAQELMEYYKMVNDKWLNYGKINVSVSSGSFLIWFLDACV